MIRIGSSEIHGIYNSFLGYSCIDYCVFQSLSCNQQVLNNLQGMKTYIFNCFQVSALIFVTYNLHLSV